MKLAEALIRTKDMKGKLSALNRQIMENQMFERVDDSLEIPSIESDIADFLKISKDLAKLKTQIAKTNAMHGMTDKIHEMEALRSSISRLERLACRKQSTVTLNRFTYDGPATPVTTVATYDVESIATTVEELRDRVRELDLDLQRLNWQIDLEE